MLTGVFEDPNGEYPAGTYARHPPGSSHAAWSKPGCELLVKLRQFDEEDSAWVKIDMADESGWSTDACGNRRLALHEFGRETVCALDLTAPAAPVAYPHGAELFVLDGSLTVNDTTATAGAWFRLPPDSELTLIPQSGATARIWMKLGHLSFA